MSEINPSDILTPSEIEQVQQMDGKEECPDCGGRYVPGPGMGVHRQAVHGNGRNQVKAKRRACPECGHIISTKDMARHRRTQHDVTLPGRRPGFVPAARPDPLTAEEITATTAALLWPKGIPHEKLALLMKWHNQTEWFLSEVSH